MPAPFTQEQVDALGRGTMDEAEVAAVLDIHERTLPKTARRPRKTGPVEIRAEELELLLRGETPDRVLTSLERSAKRDVARRRAVRGSRPRTKPPAAD